jgi:hypothetical protein
MTSGVATKRLIPQAVEFKPEARISSLFTQQLREKETIFPAPTAKASPSRTLALFL